MAKQQALKRGGKAWLMEAWELPASPHLTEMPTLAVKMTVRSHPLVSPHREI